MVVNQLFIAKPPIELLIKLINAFGLIDINDSREFSQIDMDTHNTLLTFKLLENELKACYIPCKRKLFNAESTQIHEITNSNPSISNQSNISIVRAITIFRQFLKAHDYDLYSKERFIKSVKYLVYKIVTKYGKTIAINTAIKNKTKRKPRLKEIVIVFD